MKGRPLESFVGSGTSAMLRLDFGKKGDPQVDGARSSHLLLHRRCCIAAGGRGLGYSYFSLYDHGFFYRADQFSFARRGIPALWISAGEEFESGVNHIQEFFVGGAYHTVDDEFDPAWPLESAVQTVEAAVDLALYLNRHKPKIEWKGKMTFPVED